MSNLSYETGHVIGERYRLESKLGEGGMGAVWRAEHLTLKSPVAIKFINPALASSEQMLQRFLREAQSSAALRSTHIVQVFDFGVDHGVPYIAMELLHGESLGQRLEREGTLSVAATGLILGQVARAMTHAHQAGIVHRDLKPDNVFLVREGNTEITKVLDFGVAKVTGGGLETTTGGGTKTGSILGTPYYVSPEQARGNKLVDHRSDLWALGVISYECVVGTLPFHSDGLGDLLLQICGDQHPPPSSRARVPQGFDAWMERALAKDPDQRFQSASEMFEAYQALLSQPGSDVSAEVPGPQGFVRSASATSQGLSMSTAPEAKRRGRKALLAATGGLALLGVGGALWLNSGSAPGSEAVPSATASAAAAVAPSFSAGAVSEAPRPSAGVVQERLPAPKEAPVPSSTPPVEAPAPPAKPVSRAPVKPVAPRRTREAVSEQPASRAAPRETAAAESPPEPTKKAGASLFEDRR